MLRSEIAHFLARYLNENIATGRIRPVVDLQDDTGPSFEVSLVNPVDTSVDVQFTSDERIYGPSLTADDFVVNLRNALITSITANPDDGIAINIHGINVGIEGARFAGDSITLKAGAVTDRLGNAGPVRPIVVPLQ